MNWVRKLDKKLLIVRCRGRILTALKEGDKVVELHLDEEERNSLLGNIYIGRVHNIVKNIHAAFIEVETDFSAIILFLIIKTRFSSKKEAPRSFRPAMSFWCRSAGKI